MTMQQYTENMEKVKFRRLCGTKKGDCKAKRFILLHTCMR